MKKGAARNQIKVLALGALLAASFFVFSAPQHAAAADLSVQTKQVIPPGSACAPLSASNFTPYISNGVLESFTITISNSSYVAVLGSAGNAGIPFYSMHRSIDASGNLTMQVMVPSVPVSGTLPINVTYLSAPGAGEPVCLAVVSTTITGTTATIPTTSIPSPVSTVTPSTPITTAPTGNASSSVATSAPSTTIAVATTTAVVPAAAGSIGQNMCSTSGGAARLWYVLLAIYALLAAIIALAEFPSDWPQNIGWRSGAIIILLLALLLFWYFSPACRPLGAWPAVIAVLIALAGIVGAYQTQPAYGRIWLLGEKNNS